MHVVQQGEAVSKMTEEKYLSLKNYPELYDKGHHNYKDTDLKGNIWESISKELDKPGMCDLLPYVLKYHQRRHS